MKRILQSELIFTMFFFFLNLIYLIPSTIWLANYPITITMVMFVIIVICNIVSLGCFILAIIRHRKKHNQ